MRKPDDELPIKTFVGLISVAALLAVLIAFLRAGNG